MGWEKILTAALTAFGAGLLTWAGLAIRRAARNAGRTEQELALEELAEAMREEKEARDTLTPEDDAAAVIHLRLARERSIKARRVKAILDALGEEP